MRIAHVISTPAGFGGAERITLSLVQAAIDDGHQAVLLNPFAVDPSVSILSIAARSADYRGRPASLARELPSTRRWLRHELSVFRPDVVHAHLFHAAALVASLPNLSQRILTHHQGAFFDYSRRPVRKWLDGVIGKRFDRVVAVSASAERFLIDAYGYPAHKVIAIPNGWTGDPVPRQYGDGDPVIICAANFRAEKMHSVLLDALAIVRAAVPSVRLILLGDGPLRADLEALVERLRLKEIVSFEGAVTDVWSWYARADVVAISSSYESFGMAALEGMAAGLPVIATRVGALPELVTDGETGLLIPPGDSKALADAIFRLTSSPSEARSMGEAGRLRADQFSMKKMTHAYLSLYKEVVQAGDGRL